MDRLQRLLVLAAFAVAFASGPPAEAQPISSGDTIRTDEFKVQDPGGDDRLTFDTANSHLTLVGSYPPWPSLFFGDQTVRFYNPASGQLVLYLAGGSGSWLWTNSAFQSPGVSHGPSVRRRTGTATDPHWTTTDDATTGFGSSAAGKANVISSGVTVIETEEDGVYIGPAGAACKDWGERETAPAGATRCHHYYDSTSPGAKCYKNNSGTWDKVGAGTCL